MNREFVQLAQTYSANKHGICGMMASEKLDGMRCLWLPETYNLPIDEVGFANTERDARAHVCSGLWSRYGKVIHAPLWFTSQLPKIPLDGELWIDRKSFQELMSTVKKLHPVDSEWKDVKYMVFESPSYASIYQAGRIFNPVFKTIFSGILPDVQKDIPVRSFESNYHYLKDRLDGIAQLHQQVMTPFTKQKAESFLDGWMSQIQALGGEGLMLRNPASCWEPKRTPNLVKLKPYFDDEAVVTGYIPGEKKYSGMLGSLIVNWRGKTFSLSGMTDRERRNWETTFPIGTVVTFRYRELSDIGIPKEARYLRIKID